jgi:hypothetical protein
MFKETRRTDSDTTGALAAAELAAPTAKQLYARERFEQHIGRLRIEVRLATRRRHLDVIVELLEWLVAEAGTGKIVDRYRTELDEAKASLTWRGRASRGRR